MTVRDVVTMINPQNIPIHFHDDITRQQLFSTRVYTADELRQFRKSVGDDHPLGVYLPNFTVNETYDHLMSQNMSNIKAIENLLQTSFLLDANQDIKYLTILFMVLHEIGHWEHFVQSGLSGADYWKAYVLPEETLYKSNYLDKVLHPDNLAEIEERYAYAYRRLPMEAEADNYALAKIIQFM